MSFLIKTQLNKAPINPSTQTNSPTWCLERKVPEWVIQIDTGYFLDKPCSMLLSYLEGHYYSLPWSKTSHPASMGTL